MGSGGIIASVEDPVIFSGCCWIRRYMWVYFISYTKFQTLNTVITSYSGLETAALRRNQWSVVQSVGRCVGPRAVLDLVEKRKFLHGYSSHNFSPPKCNDRCDNLKSNKALKCSSER
jgi:hypothetical protein